jgi:tetratricopeptide (TPR) repeat protein
MGRRRRHQSSAGPARVLKRKRLYVVLAVAAGLVVFGTGAYFVQLGRQAPGLLDVARRSADDPQTAIPFFEEYLKYRPKDAAVHAELAGVYDAAGRSLVTRNVRQALQMWDQSVSSYESSLTFDSADTETRRKLTRLYLGLGKIPEGKRHAEVLLNTPALKGEPEVHELMAACELKTPQAAADHLRRAIGTGKAGTDTYLRLAYLLKRDVNTPDAHREADEVMRRLVTQDKPTDLTARLARARFFFESNRRAEARDDIRYAYDKIPGGSTDVEVILAHAATLTADSPDGAREVLKKGMTTHPDEPRLLLGLAEVESQAGRKTEATDLLVRVIGRLPDSDPTLIDAADRLLDLGDGSNVLTVADRVSGSPLAAFASYLRGRAKLNAGDWPAARPLLTEAIPAINSTPPAPRKQPLLLKAYLALAAGFAAAGEFAHQEEAYQKAALVDGSSVVARLGWADALLKLNRVDDAVKQFRGIAPYSPAARFALARLQLAEANRKTPPGGRAKLDSFWEVVGRAGSYPPEVVPLVADAHLMEGEPDKAAAVLEAAVRDKPTAAMYVSLAGVKAARGGDPTAALEVLTEGERAVGLSVELQLTRAMLMLRRSPPDAAAVAALADVGQFSPADRFRLQTAIGELLLPVGKGTEGVKLLQTAARERPNDLTVRQTLFDWAIDTGDAALRDATLDDIRRLDGPTGPVTVVAEVSRDMASAEPLSIAKRAELTARLTDARPKREGWGRIPYLLGVLARDGGREDEALELFQTASAKGEKSERLVREVVRLLIRQERYPQAIQFLAGVRGSTGLSPDLDRRYRLMEALASPDPARAIEWVKRPEVLMSRNHQDQLLRGLVMAQAGKLDDAQQAFLAAQTIAPAAPEVYVTRVRALVAAGLKPDAIRPVLDTAAKNLAPTADTRSSAVPLALGTMHELIGDTAKAAEQYQKARAINPAEVAPVRQLYDMHLRSNNPLAAAQLLDELITSSAAEVTRWARRTRAVVLADTPPTHQSLPAALKLIDENLLSGRSLDDERARAFLLARDPFKRAEALTALDDSQARGPYTAEQSYRLAVVYLQAGDVDAAERVLTAATAAGLLASPNHLALLAQLQIKRKDTAAARTTVDRLQLVAAGQPITVVARAGLVASAGTEAELAKAAKLILDLPSADPPAVRVRTRGKELERIGCLTQAEQLYRDSMTGNADPATGHFPLAEFLVTRGRAEAAIQLALERQKTAAGCPVGRTARLVAAAVRLKPEQLMPPTRQAEFRVVAQQAEDFINDQLKRDKNNPELLAALADLTDARGRHTQAIDLYRRALEGNAKDLRPRVANNLAALKALHERDGSDATVRMVNEAIGDLGPEPSLLDTRALVHMAGERYKEAIADLQAAAGVSASPVYWFHLARCHDKLGAVSARDQAIERSKKLGLAKDHLHPLEWAEYDRLVK